jgi:acetoin utilization deacetylase AcuC-like enzyme
MNYNRNMKIVYHPRYTEVYDSDPAAQAGRIEVILKELEGRYEFVTPEPATEDDLVRVHTPGHIVTIKSNPKLYEVACLAAGGAIKSAQLAMQGEPSFGLIRPPGHHASAESCWGFCSFNNIAVALARLKSDGFISSAFILDFDLHFGDGTDNIFGGTKMIYFQPKYQHRQHFMSELEQILQEAKGYDILAVSAGFDRHIDDWGGQLTTEDYESIGKLAREASSKCCNGRRFALLEGGYNHSVLGKNVKVFIDGFA